MAEDIPREKVDLRKKLQEVPHKPGVYLMRDRLNRIIYVGKARDLRKRLSQYFAPSKQTLADIKTRALIKSIWNFDIHEVRTEPESLLLEGKLIKEFRPRYNISFRDDKRFLMLKVHLADPFPRFQLCRVKKDDSARYFGPFANAGALRQTLNWAAKQFGLRSCRPLVPGEQDYKHCHNDIIKNCSAPCVSKITREGYLERVEQACELLEGKSRALLDELEAQMQAAASKLQFEKAAELRDILDNLRKTLEPARRFTHKLGVPDDGESAIRDVEELREVLKLPSAPLIMECFDISNISTAHCVASMVRFRDGRPDKQGYRRYRIKSTSGQDDFTAMAEVVRRRYARILLETKTRRPELGESQESNAEVMERLGRESAEESEGSQLRLPDLVIVDGGKGQLSVAREELRRLGLADLPIIGLAKEFEEIYRPERADPVVLPREMGALKLLQRIRDEAHRWANGYHQLLMKRRISESILDDCPGISQRRKTALLQKFGSLARLRQGSLEEIARVPRMGKALAEDLIRFLETH